MSARRGAMVVLCAVFFVEGFVMAAIGPVLPELSTRTGASLVALGRITIALFCGSLLAQIVSGWAGDRYGRRFVLTASLALFAASTLLVAFSPSLALALAASAALGFGFGASTLSVNVMSAELAPERRASAVNLVNMFYGLGAIAGPLAVGGLIERSGRSLPALWIGGTCLAIAAAATHRALPARLPHLTADAGDATPARTASLRDPLLLACGILLLIYVGSEMAAGVWASVYLQKSAGMDAVRAAAATALFWAALTTGRIVAAAVGMRVTAEHLLTAAVWIACAGAALLWFAHGSATPSVIAFTILGLGFGPIYPTGVAVLASQFPQAAGKATSRMGILAAIGGAVLPWVHGLVLAHRPTADAALLMLASTVAMIAIWAWTRRRAHDPHTHAEV